MDVVIRPGGHVRYVYEELLDFTGLGQISISRASHVEPDLDGRWHADLSPINGPQLGPFSCRSLALAAETDWLREHWLLLAH